EELKLKPYVDLVYRYALKKERYELMKSADFGELNEAGKNPGGITRALDRPEGIEIDGRYRDTETVGDFLGDLEDVPF
ncbi:MAG: hypothetical protein GY820_23970, partial [Gammaproteobacteria bacterium]|nr:hypothetical protein [Gammaproteobacteria bacterium]